MGENKKSTCVFVLLQMHCHIVYICTKNAYNTTISYTCII